MLYVGTSGWQYQDWRGRFYPPELPSTKWLPYYAAHFDTVEINSTFYRLPPRETFATWAGRVPAEFAFAVKASAYLTHRKRLQDPQEPVERLLLHASGLGERLAVVLLQLPPDLPIALDRLEATLRAFGARARVAVEPRHPSWFVAETEALLATHRAALCLTDRGSRPQTPLWRTSEWTYVRMHEGAARPRPCYGRNALDSWARRIAERWPEGDGYVYFNNDAGGCAPRDAAAFARLAARRGLSVSRVPPAARVPLTQRARSRTTSVAGLSVR
jgi:uncharacterized protein YecE (DUF72 family)